MGKLLILGAGQYGMVARDIALAMGCFESIAFLDDNAQIAVGKLEEIDRIPHDAAFVAMGSPELRSRWYQRIRRPATLVHPGACIFPSATVGAGSLVEPGVVVSANARVGMGCILMSHCVIGHDAVVGDWCQIKYGAVVPERQQVPASAKVDCNTVFECK